MCGIIKKVLVVSNPNKIFCIVFCGVKLRDKVFLVQSDGAMKPSSCVFICIEC